MLVDHAWHPSTPGVKQEKQEIKVSCGYMRRSLKQTKHKLSETVTLKLGQKPEAES